MITTSEHKPFQMLQVMYNGNLLKRLSEPNNSHKSDWNLYSLPNSIQSQSLNTDYPYHSTKPAKSVFYCYCLSRNQISSLRWQTAFSNSDEIVTELVENVKKLFNSERKGDKMKKVANQLFPDAFRFFSL